MLDKPERTLDLIETLKTAVPFEVQLTPPPLLERLRADNLASEIEPRQLAREISYVGGAGIASARVFTRSV